MEGVQRIVGGAVELDDAGRRLFAQGCRRDRKEAAAKGERCGEHQGAESVSVHRMQ